MAAISGKYLGNLCSEFTHNPSGAKITVDGNGNGFSPIDLTATALGACMFAMMGYTAMNKGINLEGMTIDVDRVMADAPRRISEFNIIVSFTQEYTDKEKVVLQKAAETCPVKKTLSEDCKINVIMKF
ncbi:MAG: OsmC family protein [Bacteroidales bacterium]|nr:OsmC family protein [Lentimicrobiaceae bacterium]MBQ2908259.1 OsmC family protein [Bacteroidales bacterium]MBQ3594941.1 OsmC family protein [Bacteroidales bacterium]MBR6774613.1 OsmC family protein [Bacteroidales bacterium]